MKELIQLNNALAMMNNSKDPFQIKFVTYNESKQTGGEFIELKNCFKVGASYNLNENDMISVRQEHNSNHPYPIHIHLIKEFNNQKVYI